MNIEQIMARLAELRSLSEKSNDEEELKKYEEEARSLNAKLDSYKAVEQRKNEIRKLVGEGQGTTIVSENTVTGKEARTLEGLLASQEYRKAFIKSLRGKQLSDNEAKAMVEVRAFTSANTYLVPTVIADEVVNLLEADSNLFGEITMYYGKGTSKVPYSKVLNKAAKHVENASITASEDELAYLELVPGEIVKILECSKNALEMSDEAFEKWLEDNLAEKIADRVDEVIAEAIASGTFDSTNSVSGQAVSHANVIKIMKLLPARLKKGAKFLMNNATMYELFGLEDSNHRPIYNDMKDTLINVPIITDDNVEDNVIFYGNFKKAIHGKQGPVEIANSEAAGFYKATVVYRGYTTFDAKKAGTKGVIKFSVAAAQSGGSGSGSGSGQ